jgi:isoquinoline 1-oxidoreductase subunit beta
MADLCFDRRNLLIASALAGGGLAIGIVPDRANAQKLPGRATGDAEFSAWLEIAPDDTVTVISPVTEIGNGAMTQIAMNIAEELNADWTKIRVVNASMLRNHMEKNVYGVGFQPFFAGHGTSDHRRDYLLQIGASTRERLKSAAAARWKVPVAEIEAKNSLLVHAATGRMLRYGEVAAEAAKITFAVEPNPKPPSEWRLLGKASPSKLGIPDIVTGKAVYGIDVKLPGMLHAALMQSPVHGGKLKSVNSVPAKKMPGVRAVVVIDPANTKGSTVKQESTFGLTDSYAQSGVAVIADHYWQAKKALDALELVWDAGMGAKWKDEKAIYDGARALLDQGAGKPILKKGDASKMEGRRIVTGEYGTPYCDNATMEPLNATALVTAEKAEIWCPTQDLQQAYWVAIDETGLPPEKVEIHATMVGGGFGRRTQADDIRMAVAIARQFPGKPVKTIWSREETFRQGRYRTPIITRYKAVLDEQSGLPQSVTGDCAYVGSRPIFQLPFGYSDQPYFNSGIIPNIRLSTASLPVNILNGAWRAPCYNSHSFFLETFIDECAVASGSDPLDYRLKLLAKWDKPWSDCLRLVAEKSGWGKKLPKGEGLGIAISCWPIASNHAFGAVIATVAHVQITQAGGLSVKQIDVAFDCGSVANPDAVRAQIEGATYYGMNAAMNEELTVKDGAIVEGNYDEYPMIRMADVPAVNVHFGALSGHPRMAIIGEAPTGPIQPAIGNAIYAAIGTRLRRTPFIKQPMGWS